VCAFVVKSNMKVTTDKLPAQHLTVVVEAIEIISLPRRSFSEQLKGVVEEAHKALMSVVEGDDAATEAYASFHDALFRLPRLSKDHIVACVDELSQLVGAADAMVESETEVRSHRPQPSAPLSLTPALLLRSLAHRPSPWCGTRWRPRRTRGAASGASARRP
jgi:hypothetical protein